MAATQKYFKFAMYRYRKLIGKEPGAENLQKAHLFKQFLYSLRSSCLQVRSKCWFTLVTLPETTSAILKIGLLPNSKVHLPTIDFQALCFSFKGGNMIQSQHHLKTIKWPSKPFRTENCLRLPFPSGPSRRTAPAPPRQKQCTTRGSLGRP